MEIPIIHLRNFANILPQLRRFRLRSLRIDNRLELLPQESALCSAHVYRTGALHVAPQQAFLVLFRQVGMEEFADAPFLQVPVVEEVVAGVAAEKAKNPAAD